MQIAMVGLGRMGGAMSERLRRGGHEVIGFDRDPGVSDVDSLESLVRALRAPRAVWVMVPAGEPTSQVLAQLRALLEPGDVVVDGGNSHYRDSIARAVSLDDAGIMFVDAGTSGGIWGLEHGYCFMLGGTEDAVARILPAVETLAVEGGFAHVGPPGAGHFTKMVHNAIEYGMMQSFAEGFELLETAPEFPGLDLPTIAELWRHGSVIRSWLLDLAARALQADPELGSVRGWVQDSGEGRWAVAEALDAAVPVPVIASALFARFASRQEDSFSMRLLAALRREFGGHEVRDA